MLAFTDPDRVVCVGQLVQCSAKAGPLDAAQVLLRFASIDGAPYPAEFENLIKGVFRPQHVSYIESVRRTAQGFMNPHGVGVESRNPFHIMF